MELERSWRRPASDLMRPAARPLSWLRWLSAAALVAGCAGVATLAAQGVFSVTDLEKAMRATERNVDLVNKAIAANDFDTAKMRIARAREQLAPTFSFWTIEKRPDGMKMVRNATAAMDDLDAVLSATPVNASAVTASMARVDAACQACHAIYRQEDAATRTFTLKPRPW